MAESAGHLSIHDIEALEEILSRPSDAVVQTMAELQGDLVVLGVGGKMGPTLARMAKRASDTAGVSRRVIGVSRFSGSSALQQRLQSWGIETHGCDLLDRDSYGQLPDAANVVFMAGMKFGSTGQEALTWAMNAFVPGLVSERYRSSRIAVFSTGNVYGLSPVSDGGSVETDALRPQGEYALSCLGRERIFEYFSRTYQIKMSILRLNYAVELRYGVLLDIARKVFSGQVIPLQMGYLNAIWQADAADLSLRALGHASTPPFVINVAGAEILSVRWVAEQFAERFNTQPHFEGAESGDALLNNAQKSHHLFNEPGTPVVQMLAWIADWVARSGETLDKPTHFENRSGNF